MKRIFVPTAGARDWQRLLAKPILQWKKGHSAMTTAACWEETPGQLPSEVKAILDSSNQAELTDLRLLAALPEWKVPLPGGAHSSCTDVLALVSNSEGLVAVAVEAKVDEAFGPTLREKRADPSNGALERMSYLHKVLRRESPLDDNIRYQLLHRTASALLTATDFHASAAVMLVHSFSPTACWRDDFDAFSCAMSATPLSDHLSVVPGFAGPKLYLAWCAGNQAFLDTDLAERRRIANQG